LTARANLQIIFTIDGLSSDLEDGILIVKDDLRALIKDYFGISIIDMSGDDYWTVDDVGLMIYPDGTTDFVSCTTSN